MQKCVIVQIRCKPGTTYEVAGKLADREVHSVLYSTSGEFDLLMTMYVADGEDIGKFVNDNVADIEGVERTFTTLTFNAF